MAKPILVGAGATAPRSARPRSFGSETGWAVITVLAVALTVIGWLDILLIWYPYSFSSTEWEFATISAMFNALPLGTLGVVILAIVAAARERGQALRRLSVAFWLIGLFLAASFLFFALDAVIAWKAALDHVRPALRLSILKTSAYAAIYVMLYSWLGTYTWRRSHMMRRTPRSR